MAEKETATSAPDLDKPEPIPFVASEPRGAGRLAAGTLSAVADFGAVALVLHPDRPTKARVRLLLTSDDALKLKYQLSDAACKLSRRAAAAS